MGLRERGYLSESMTGFRAKGISALKSGKVLRSRYATVGPEKKATGDGGYSVYDDVKREKKETSSPGLAFEMWHRINLREFDKSNYAYRVLVSKG